MERSYELKSHDELFITSTLACITTEVLGNISRDTLFLRSYHASSLSTLTLLLSVTTAYALTAATQQLAALAASVSTAGAYYAATPAALGAGLFVLALSSLVAPAMLARATSVAIYMWLEIAAQLLAGQFWDLCAKAFDVSESKKFFGFITFGTTFGTLLASLVVLPTLQARELPTECNLIVAAVLLLVIASVLLFSADRLVPPPSSSAQPTASASGKKDAGRDNTTKLIADIQLRTYLKHICFFDMLATVVRVLVDNTTLSVLSRQDEAHVKASLTQINSVQSFLMIPLQLASGPFFTHFGVMYGIATLPISVFLFGAATTTSTATLPLVLSRALYNAISLAIFNPARELLWLPFNASERGRFKSFVSGPFRSLSRIVGAILSIVLTTGVVIELVGESCMSVLMMIASLAWALDAMAARKSYAAEFYASLKQGYLDLSSPLVDFTPDQLALVKETLVSGAQNQVNYVLSSLSSDHVSLIAQELRDLFHRRNEHHDSTTPLHTKLRLLSLHTAARRRFMHEQQAALFLPSSSDQAPPPGIFNAMDLLMIIQDKSPITSPRQLRVAAILACGFEKGNVDTENCFSILRQVMRHPDEDRSVVVCAAVALLRLSDWMDEEANMVLQRMLHDDQRLDARVTCLKIVGKELPELLGDGFLVYLLHHPSASVVQAAVECCSTSTRHSRMLIPALMKHLGNSSLCGDIVAALQGFDVTATWVTLEQFVESTLNSEPPASKDPDRHRLDSLAGALKVLSSITFPLQDKLELLMKLIDRLIIEPALPVRERGGDGATTRYSDPLFRLFGRDLLVQELVVDALVSLLASTDDTIVQTHSHHLHELHLALDTKIREAFEMRHVLELFHDICPRSASSIEETSPLLLQHVEHSVKDTQRMILKLLSTGFPREFSVTVIVDGLQSELPQVHSAIQEVLETLLPSSHKSVVLALLFPKPTSSKSVAKIESEIRGHFCERLGVDILLDTMSCEERHVELSCLALQYYLHIAEDHASCITEPMATRFQDDVLPHLLQNEMARELLIEVYHSRRHVLPYEALTTLDGSEPPLISKIAISNCLRVSALFEDVCAISVLRMLSHRFVPVTVAKGETILREGELATAMFVVASGTVQLHKERRILAELGYGTCVGQAALLRHSLHEGSHIATATAVSDSILLRVSRADLDALIHETPRVSRGVLNAVASSLRSLYFEPLNTIAQSGSLPRRDRRSSLVMNPGSAEDAGAAQMLRRTTSMSSSIKAAMSVNRAASSFLYSVGRERTSEPVAPLSLPGKMQRNRSFQSFVSGVRPRRSDVFPSIPAPRALSLSNSSVDGSGDYSTFEKSIHLKGSQLMKNLDDEKVSLVAQLVKVISLEHGQVLYDDGANASAVYVIVEGTITISTSPKTDTDPSLFSNRVVELRHGDCFGEESFVENTTMNGQAKSIGRSTLFEIPTKELVDLSEVHADLLHVLLAWLAQKLARAIETMVAPLLSPTGARSSDSSETKVAKHWDDAFTNDTSDDEGIIANGVGQSSRRRHKWRSETD
ncbi:hypothetical protein PINS_up010780 [Pythium insidiosum]|nr:hypothetical protein PINS_up010780 [Pythium insidiosum]